jgi:hypothetical protein
MNTSLLKKLEEKEFVFLGAQELKGVSQKEGPNKGRAYEMYILSFADPTTYENHQLNYKKDLDLSYLGKGEKVTLVLELVTGFGNKNSAVQVIDVIPVK